MKVFILLVAGLLSTGCAFGQSVVFGNTASPAFKIYTNTTTCGPMSGLNQIRIGLYVGALGSSESSLVLIGLATNLANPALPGYFSGGYPFFLPSPYAPGDTISFQVRAWAFAGGLSYEEAIANAAVLGHSSLGFTTLGGGLFLPGPLFGTNPGQVGGFTIGWPETSSTVICIPEPSTYALGLLGVALFGLLGRRRR